jgi:hypothetical protein
MKKILVFITVMFFLLVKSQVKITNTNDPTFKEGVALEIQANNKGVIFPRVELTNLRNKIPLPNTIPHGTLVYKAGTEHGSFPDRLTQGYYWWDTSLTPARWVSLDKNINTTSIKCINSFNVNAEFNPITLELVDVPLCGDVFYNDDEKTFRVINNSTIEIKRAGLYSVAVLLSLDRLNGGRRSRIALQTSIYKNNTTQVGTRHVVNLGETSSVNDGRGLFSYAYTEYLLLERGDRIKVRLGRIGDYYGSLEGLTGIQFLPGGQDSSLVIQRIR